MKLLTGMCIFPQLWFYPIFFRVGVVVHSPHRCTRVENPGGYLKFLPKSLGGQGFQEKLPGGGGPPISGFIAFLLTSFLKICLGGGVQFHTPLPLPHQPSFIYAFDSRFDRFMKNNSRDEQNTMNGNETFIHLSSI